MRPCFVNACECTASGTQSLALGPHLDKTWTHDEREGRVRHRRGVASHGTFARYAACVGATLWRPPTRAVRRRESIRTIRTTSRGSSSWREPWRPGIARGTSRHSPGGPSSVCSRRRAKTATSSCRWIPFRPSSRASKCSAPTTRSRCACDCAGPRCCSDPDGSCKRWRIRSPFGSASSGSAAEIGVRQEHLFAECLSTQLRVLLTTLEGTELAPVVVLATFPGELHGLGLEMVAVHLASRGAIPRLLGPNCPSDQIAEAAIALRADVVGLSISTASRPRAVERDLRKLIAALGKARVSVWLGGAGARRIRTLDRRVGLVRSASEIDRAIARARRSGGTPGP